jgi:hypothetical protein
MKNRIFYTGIILAIVSCTQEYAIEKRDSVFLEKRDLMLADPAIKVKPAFVSLPAGAVSPQGWIKDCAVAAANGITGHLDEWSVTYEMAWKGVGFEATGADPETGMGWPLEQASYWLDGAVRLAYMLDDAYLKQKITARLDRVVDGVLNGGESFIYWQKGVDYKKRDFENWAHSHMGRALVAYYEASGNPRILEALTKVYGNFELVPVPHLGEPVSGCNNADPMLDVYQLSGDKRILDAVVKMAGSDVTKETVQKWNHGAFHEGHGVIDYENLRIPAMMYPYTNNPELLEATRSHLEWLDSCHTQPHGIASSEEHLAGIGSTRNTETCNVACSAWTYQQLYEITGEGKLGDRIEKIFFNAASAPVARDYHSMAYYQSPNRIDSLMPADLPRHPGQGSYTFCPTGHVVLCCVGNLTRVIPNYIMHAWMGTADKGIAATLYGPSIVNTAVNEGIPVRITSITDYPFDENILLHIEPASSCKFPLYLRIPGWCKKPVITVNGKSVEIHPTDGFVKIDRKWKSGDRLTLHFPMEVELITGRETPYPQTPYFAIHTRPIARQTDISSPFRTVYYGPLLFALPVKDHHSNEQVPGQKWNYALAAQAAASVTVSRSPMPAEWRWQIEDAPVRLKVKAVEFDWQPTHILPLPKEPVSGGHETEITLVPYGCTKFRISMFPIAKE